MVLSSFMFSSRRLLTPHAVKVYESSQRTTWLRNPVGLLASSTPITVLLVVLTVFVGELDSAISLTTKSYEELPPRLAYYTKLGVRLNCTIFDEIPFKKTRSSDTVNGGVLRKPLIKPQIVWFKLSESGTGVEINDGPRYEILEDGRQLRIRPYQQASEIAKEVEAVKGGYYCEIRDRLGVTRSRTCSISPVYSSNPIKVVLESDSFYPHLTAVLKCKISPTYFYKYYRIFGWNIISNGHTKLIRNSTKKYSVIRNANRYELLVHDVNEDDGNSKYECVLKSTIWNNFTLLKASKVPEVTSGPVISAPYVMNDYLNVHMTGEYGSEIELPCVFHIPQSPRKKINYTYQWKHKDQIIYPLNDPQQIRWTDKYRIVTRSNGNLIIKNLVERDAGDYTCTLMGSKTDNRPKISLKITHPLNVKMIPSLRKVDFMKPTNFTCEIHGSPNYKLFWLKDGEKLNPSKNIVFSQKSKVLTILKTERKNIGIYQCFVLDGSKIPPDDNAQARGHLEVDKMPPNLISQFPKVEVGRTSGYYKLASRLGGGKLKAHLRCDFEGSSPLSINWYHDDVRIGVKSVAYSLPHSFKELVIDVEKMIKNGRRQDAVVEIGGMYMAEAVNDYGTSRCKTYVEIDSEMTIRDFKKNQHAIEGRDFRLKCYVIGNGAFKGLKIRWTINRGGDDLTAPSNHRHEIMEGGRIFLIKNVKKEEDDGVYKCVAENLAGKTVFKSTSLDVSRLPIITKFVHQRFIHEGKDSVSQSCNVMNQANKPWYAWWHYEGPSGTRDLLSSSTMEGVDILYSPTGSGESTDTMVGGVVVPNGIKPNSFSTLLIEYPNRRRHAGNYTCFIINRVGRSNETFTMIFKHKIKFDKRPPAQKEVILFSDLKLDCTAQGGDSKAAKPRIEWKYYMPYQSNYRPVSILEKKTKKRISQLENGTLVVNNISRADPVQYMCFISMESKNAEASVEAISQVVNVKVHYPAHIQPIKNEERKVEDKFNLTCNVSGDGEIETKWLYFNEDSKEFQELTVPCVTMNGGTSPTGFKTLACQNYGSHNYNPPGHINNIIRYKVQSEKDHSIIYRLTFTNVQASLPKIYKCKARNKYNEGGTWAEREVKLTVIDVPSPPQKVVTSLTTNTSFYVDWKPPKSDGNKPILYYLVTYSRNYPFNAIHGKPTEVNVSVTQNKLHIKGLHPSYEYSVDVQAVNAVGSSNKESTYQRTKESAPTGSVRNISANGTSSNTIRVSWLEPAPDKVNGKLTSYSVCLMEVVSAVTPSPEEMAKLDWSKANCHSLEIKDNSFPLQEEFNSLPKFTKFIVRVFPINKMGAGPPDFTDARTLEDVPQGPPVEVTCTPRDTHVQLQWNPPKQDKMNGILTGYSVRYFVTNDYEDESKMTKNLTSSSSAVIRQLRHFTNYTFRINAVNSKGSGPPSEDITCMTKPSQPDPPKEVKLYAVNSSCVVASWKHPVHSNGILKMYEIRYTASDRSRETKTVQIVANTSKDFNYKFLCNLDGDTEYYVQIRAKNHAPFESNFSEMVSARTTSMAPSRILAFNRTLTTHDNANLQLSCEYVPDYHDNDITLSWSRKVPGGRTQNLDDGKYLTLKEIKQHDQGEYKCRVSNNYGEDYVVYNIVVQVIKQTPPNPPVLFGDRQNLHSLEVEWKSTGSSRTMAKGVPIEQYLLTYTNMRTRQTREIELPATNRTFFLSKLTCATLVKFSIKAVNKIGHSIESNELKMRTRGSAPVPGDTSLLYKKKHRTSIYMNLNQVFHPGSGCPPLYYRIWMAPVTSTFNREPRRIEHENLENQCCYNLTGLNAGSVYRYKIEATNAAGGVNISGQMYTLNLDGSVPVMERVHDISNSSLWRQPPFLIGLIFALVIVLSVALVLVFIWRRRQLAEQMREHVKSPVNPQINNLKGDHGKSEGGLPQPFVGQLPGSVPTSRIRPPIGEVAEDGFSDDGSVDSEGNINPYATFVTYEPNTLEHTDAVPKELGPVSIASGQMRERMHHHPRNTRKRTPYYEARGQMPKQYENESVPGTLGHKPRRSNSMEDVDSAYNKGYATGGGGQMGRSYYESKYTDGMPYRVNSVISSTTMSSNHDELTQAYEYGRKARIESGLYPHDVEDTLDLHTGSGSSETTDPGIRQFTQQPPMPDEQRQATCEVPLLHNQRRTSLNPSETYEAVDEAYYKRAHRQPTSHPARHAPLPELPNLSTSTLGRPLKTAAGIKAGQFRNRNDSDTIYGGGPGHVYDSTDSYYSSYTPNNFGRRPMGATGNSAASEFPRQRNAPGPSRYYNNAGAAAERRPLVGPSTSTGSRPMPYGASAPGADPDEARALLMNNRRYSGSRTRDSGVGTSGGESIGSIAPPSRRPIRNTTMPPAAVRADAPPGLQGPPPRPGNSDSEGENIYTSEFTVV